MALFDRFKERMEARAGAMAEQALAVTEAAWATFTDVLIRREGDTLILYGRGLMRRWLDEARLRFAWRSQR